MPTVRLRRDLDYSCIDFPESTSGHYDECPIRIRTLPDMAVPRYTQPRMKQFEKARSTRDKASRTALNTRTAPNDIYYIRSIKDLRIDDITNSRNLRISYHNDNRKLLTLIFLVFLSLTSLFDSARCQVLLHEGPKGIVTSILNVASNSTNKSILSTDRVIRHGRARLRQRHASATVLDVDEQRSPDAENDEKRQTLSKAAFRQLSRMAFKAMVSEDFHDRSLGPAEDDDQEMSIEERKQYRRQQRRLQRQRQKQLKRQHSHDGGDLLPPPSQYNHGELIDQQDESIDRNDHRLLDGHPDDHRPFGRRRAVAIATKDSIKPDTCRTVPLKQRVRMTGCVTQIVVSHFCYGQCNSFYIPKLSKKRLRAAFESCSVCKPKSYAPVSVTLHCPSRNPPFVKKKIMKVKECACMPANLSENDVVGQS